MACLNYFHWLWRLCMLVFLHSSFSPVFLLILVCGAPSTYSDMTGRVSFRWICLTVCLSLNEHLKNVKAPATRCSFFTWSWARGRDLALTFFFCHFLPGNRLRCKFPQLSSSSTEAAAADHCIKKLWLSLLASKWLQGLGWTLSQGKCISHPLRCF